MPFFAKPAWGAGAAAPTEDAAADDAALLRRVGAGDAAAFRAVADAVLKQLVRYCSRLLSNQAEAEEVAQETFLKLWQNPPRAEDGVGIRTWLYRVAHNLCIDRLRRSRVASNYSGLATSAETDASQLVHPNALLEQKRIAESISAALELLPERQRAALLLAHYEEMSHADAARVLEMSVAAFESLLARARRTLRSALSAHAPKDVHAQQ